MKKIFFSLTFLLPFLLFGQTLSSDFKVTMAKPFQVVDAASKEYISLDNGFTISAKTHGEKVILQKFDVNGMEEVERKEYEDLEKYAKFQDLIRVKDRVYYIYEAFNKKYDNFTVYCREIDTETLKFNETKKLFKTKKEVIAPGNFWMTRNPNTKFSVTSSFDASKIMIYYRTKPESRNDKTNYDRLGFHVFDDLMDPIWGDEVKMPHTEANMNNLCYAVSKKGTAYMLARVNKTESFDLITVNAEGLENQKLEVKDGLIFDEFHLIESPNGNVIAAGYYANGRDFKGGWGTAALSININGLYLFEIDQEGIIIREKEFPFSLELINKYASERSKSKATKREADGNAGINDLKIQETILNEDGSLVVIGEVTYAREEFFGPQQVMVTHHGDMIITKIDENGEIAWQDKLPKNQACKSAETWNVASLGMSYIKGDGAHYVIFADNRKNADLSINEAAEPHKGGYGGFLSAYKINDSDGTVEKHLILDLSDIDGQKAYQFRVSRIFEAEDGTFLMEIYIKGKKDSIVKMELVD